MGSAKANIVLLVLTYVGFLVVGAVGFRLWENMPWIDAIYSTIIIATTTAAFTLNEFHALSPSGQTFSICLVLIAIIIYGYTIGAIVNYLLEGELRGIFQRRKLRDQIMKMQNHYIVCGFGRVGFEVAQQLHISGKPVLVIEEAVPNVERATQLGFTVIQGNANNDDILKSAGVERAAGLMATLGTDAANMMLIVSGRSFNKGLLIVGRANDEASAPKLIRAGADRVISPHALGGRRMAQVALRPHVVDFLDVVMHDQTLELWMEDIRVASGGQLDGRAIGEAKIRETTGVNVLGIRQPDGRITVAPTVGTALAANDVLIALGTREQLNQLAKMAG